MSDFVQIKLHDDGEGIEEVWARAVDAGLYEIASVPFLHMSPTSGDIIAASKDETGGLRFDKVVKKGGRWVAVYNWYPQKGATAADVITKLAGPAKAADLVIESCLEPKPGQAGCVYVAAPTSVTPEQLDSILSGAGAAADLERVLPVAFSPGKPTRPKAKALSKPKPNLKAKAAVKKAKKSATKAKPKAKAKPAKKAAKRPAKKSKPKSKSKPKKRR